MTCCLLLNSVSTSTDGASPLALKAERLAAAADGEAWVAEGGAERGIEVSTVAS